MAVVYYILILFLREFLYIPFCVVSIVRLYDPPKNKKGWKVISPLFYSLKDIL